MADVLVEYNGQRKRVPQDLAERLQARGGVIVGAATPSPMAEVGGSRRSGRGRTATPEDLEPSLIDRAKDLFTGDSRRTATTEAASDITMSPEWNAIQQAGIAGPMPAQGEASPGAMIKRAALTGVDAITGGLASGVQRAGKMAASPQEQFQMILDANPGIEPQTDEKGNRFFQSADGKVYSEQPGLRLTDVPRIAANVGAFAGAGAATTVPRAIAAGAATQAALEAGQASAGGDFDLVEVGLAGGLQAIGPALGAVRAARAAKPAVDAGVDAATEVVEGAAKAPTGKAIDKAELAKLFTEASGKGTKATAARMKLADLAAVDPAAEQAFSRLGIDAPVDLLSNNPQLRSKMGLARSKLGSEAQATFGEAVDDIIKKADDAVKDLGAVTSNGMASPQAASAAVLGRLSGTRAEIELAEDAAHNAIRAVIPDSTPIDLSRLKAELAALTKNVGKGSLSKGEKNLQRLVDSGNIPYGGLHRERQLVGKATRDPSSPFADMDRAAAKRLYGILAETQLDTAEAAGGKLLREQLQAANKLTVARKELEDKILAGFGKDGAGDLSSRMSVALKGAKGDKAKPLTDLLEIVPEDMHKSVIATGLAKETERGGKFAPDLFIKMYNGLRANPEAYKVIVKKLGEPAANVMRDVFEVSKRLVDATGKVKHTGASLQEFEALLGGNGLMARMLNSQMGRNALRAGGGVVGAGFGGPVGGGVGAGAAGSLIEAIANARKDILPSIGKLFISPEFKAMAIEMQRLGKPTPETVRKVARSKFWRDFAKAANIPRDPAAGEQWLTAALQAARQEREQ
jgi:hypothetical protein